MENVVVYVHGKGGSASEAEHYKSLFSDSKVIGFDYAASTPWEAKKEFSEFFIKLRKLYKCVTLIANSVGAFFSMNALDENVVDKAYFISPVVDMERLILNMIAWANVTESDLEKRGEIPTDFGEVLSWRYLRYVRDNPIVWRVPTAVLYGERDNLTSYETISAFAEKTGADLTVMRGGEHWFHTSEQMRFLDEWIVERK